MRFFRIALVICFIGLLMTSIYPQKRKQSRPVSQDNGQIQSQKFWSKYVVTCNGSTYMRLSNEKFLELSGFYISMDYAPITEADKLNGVQAKGFTRVRASAHRYFYNVKWHEWRNGVPMEELVFDAKFQKYKGQWIFQGTGYFNDYAQTMSCSNLPRSSSAENPLLRFDGLYRLFGEDYNPKDDTTFWFKFYQDGTVSFVMHQNEGYKNSGSWWTIQKVWSCLSSINQGEPCRPEVYQGTYSINNSVVEYKLTQNVAGRTHTFEGKAFVEQNAVKIQFKHGGCKDGCKYEFVKAN